MKTDQAIACRNQGEAPFSRDTSAFPLSNCLICHTKLIGKLSEPDVIDGFGDSVHAVDIRTISNKNQGLKVTRKCGTVQLMVTRSDDEARRGFSQRLNEALDDYGVAPKYHGRQEKVAEMFAPLSQKGARKWLEGEAIPQTSKIPVIAARLGVRAEWLLSGNGPKKTPMAIGPWEQLVEAGELPSQAEELFKSLARAARSGKLSIGRLKSMTHALLGDQDAA